MDPTVGRSASFDPWLHHVGKTRGVTEIRHNFDGPIGAQVPAAVRDAQRLQDAYSVLAAEAITDEPWCVIHGDPHVANLYVDGDGRPSILDWQLAQRGPWYLDVGYHLAATLPVSNTTNEETRQQQGRHQLPHATRAFNYRCVSGTISNQGNAVIPLDHRGDGRDARLRQSGVHSIGDRGLHHDWPRVLALLGGAYGGGFTLNSGTVIVRGVNAMGMPAQTRSRSTAARSPPMLPATSRTSSPAASISAAILHLATPPDPVCSRLRISRSITT